MIDTGGAHRHMRPQNTSRCVSQAAEPGDQKENEAPALSTASQGGGLTHGIGDPL